MAVWRCANFRVGQGNNPSDLLEDNLRYVISFYKMNHLPMSNRLLPFWIMWRIWKSRNEYLFQKKTRVPAADAKKSVEEVYEWIEANVDCSHSLREQVTRPCKDKRWIPPPSVWIKCNFDSTYVSERNFTGTGWILRDHLGNFLQAGCTKLQEAHSPLQAEALGFLHALQQIWALAFRFVWFEGDNKELATLINKNEDHLNLGNLLYDIRYWMAKLPHSSLDFVNREKNSAADKLSKYASDIDTLFCNYSTPPRWLLEYLYSPFTI